MLRRDGKIVVVCFDISFFFLHFKFIAQFIDIACFYL